MLKRTVVLLITLVGVNAWADGTPYKGEGGQIEAYGKIMGTYFVSLAFTEVCGEDPTYKGESENTARNYLNANQSLLNDVRKKLNVLAVRNGGEKERLRLNSEIQSALAQMENEAKVEAKKQVVSKKSCASILANLRKGVMDIKTQRGNEIALISTVAAADAFDESLLRGLVAGCIDREAGALGREPTIDEKRAILNFCYCRAPSVAALMPDAASKQKMMLKDPAMMDAIKRIDNGCITGVKSGRRFYPKP